MTLIVAVLLGALARRPLAVDPVSAHQAPVTVQDHSQGERQ
jgi:hypothetical protein